MYNHSDWGLDWHKEEEEGKVSCEKKRCRGAQKGMKAKEKQNNSK